MFLLHITFRTDSLSCGASYLVSGSGRVGSRKSDPRTTLEQAALPPPHTRTLGIHKRFASLNRAKFAWVCRMRGNYSRVDYSLTIYAAVLSGPTRGHRLIYRQRIRLFSHGWPTVELTIYTAFVHEILYISLNQSSSNFFNGLSNRSHYKVH